MMLASPKVAPSRNDNVQAEDPDLDRPAVLIQKISRSSNEEESVSPLISLRRKRIDSFSINTFQQFTRTNTGIIDANALVEHDKSGILYDFLCDSSNAGDTDGLETLCKTVQADMEPSSELMTILRDHGWIGDRFRSGVLSGMGSEMLTNSIGSLCLRKKCVIDNTEASSLGRCLLKSFVSNTLLRGIVSTIVESGMPPSGKILPALSLGNSVVASIHIGGMCARIAKEIRSGDSKGLDHITWLTRDLFGRVFRTIYCFGGDGRSN